MKNLYIALSFAVGTLTISAQNKDTKSADNLFKKFEYVDAAKAYLKLVENGKSDGYVYKQLADSYYNIFDTAEAAKWYAKAVESSQDAETYYRYAQMLKANGKYEDSNKTVQKLAKDYSGYKYFGSKGLIIMANNFYKMDDSYQATVILDAVIKNFKEFQNVVDEATVELQKIKSEESKTNSSITE